MGEAGAGKSRLIAEARQMAVLLGVRVAGATCLPLTTPLPLDPVHNLLRSLGQPIASTVGESPRDLFRLVREQVEQATIPGPLLLCLDDMQWSDAATIDLIHYCLARPTDVPLAWLLAARSGRSQTRVVHRLGRGGLLDRLELTTLSADETRLLAETKLGASEVSPSVVAALYERTSGNPFLCVELLRAISGAGAGAEPAPANVTGTLDALVPPTVRDAIEERADRPAPTARAAFEWAVMLPTPFGYDELEAVAGVGAGNAPEELADAGFLISDPAGRWGFLHSLGRDAVYTLLPEAERLRRHAVVADALADGPLSA